MPVEMPDDIPTKQAQEDCLPVDLAMRHRGTWRKETVKWATINNSHAARTFARRSFLETVLGSCAITPIVRLRLQLGAPGSGSLTKEQGDRMTPTEVIEELKKGNERFRRGRWLLGITWQRNAQVPLVSILQL
jgi:hypothetical protein